MQLQLTITSATVNTTSSEITCESTSYFTTITCVTTIASILEPMSACTGAMSISATVTSATINTTASEITSATASASLHHFSPESKSIVGWVDIFRSAVCKPGDKFINVFTQNFPEIFCKLYAYTFLAFSTLGF